ncbi:MAG: RNase adapter RapZ [Microbacteriaceae bacterium]|jgi:UPF0042 nucleotide-binding protein
MNEQQTHRQEVLIVTGMSGAGRSTVANALEDLGWYVVDNLPPQMLRPMIELAERAGDSLPRVAAVMDVRGGKLFSDLQEVLEGLDESVGARVLFLEATDSALVRRFEQVRRPHPLQGDGTILDGILEERARTRELRAFSALIIDTSDLNIHQLSTKIQEMFGLEDQPGLHLTVQSFGFKYGLPSDVDLVADARFLPNPFWVPELRPHTGLDPQVSDYVLGLDGARPFLERYAASLEPVLHGYQQENKRHATIAIGCTGGKHRSVAMAVALAELLRGYEGVAVSVRHRDLGRE